MEFWLSFSAVLATQFNLSLRLLAGRIAINSARTPAAVRIDVTRKNKSFRLIISSYEQGKRERERERERERGRG